MRLNPNTNTLANIASIDIDEGEGNKTMKKSDVGPPRPEEHALEEP